LFKAYFRVPAPNVEGGEQASTEDKKEINVYEVWEHLEEVGEEGEGRQD
jgi:hypothetical protein